MRTKLLLLAMILTTTLFVEDAAGENLFLHECTFDKLCASVDEKRHLVDCNPVEPPRVFEFCGAVNVRPLEKPDAIIIERKNSFSNELQPRAQLEYTVTEHTIKNEGLTIAWTVSDGPQGAERSYLLSVALLMGVAILLSSSDPISFEMPTEELPFPIFKGVCGIEVVQTCEGLN